MNTPQRNTKILSKDGHPVRLIANYLESKEIIFMKRELGYRTKCRTIIIFSVIKLCRSIVFRNRDMD